jgi:starch phosphorylase
MGKNGWAIGAEIPESADQLDTKYEDEVDVASLFHVLETQILPLYYAKPDGRLPLAWLNLMRESIRTIVPVFNTHRMVAEYTQRLYEPASRAYAVLTAGGSKRAVEISQWKSNMRRDWQHVNVTEVTVRTGNGANVLVGERLDVSARVALGPSNPRKSVWKRTTAKTKMGRLPAPRRCRSPRRRRFPRASIATRAAFRRARAAVTG